MRHVLTTTPTALPDIVTGTRYTIQNRSPHIVFLQTTATEPPNADEAFAMNPDGPQSAGIVRANTGESVWIWVSSIQNGAGAVVYDEAA